MPTGQQIFQLRIELDEVTPAVWRRLLVPGGIRLAKLHLILQAAMGWTNSHLHAFTIDGERYGMHLGDDFLDEDLDLLDEKSVTVIRALGDRSRITYEELLLTLADPSHEDHAELLEWIGGPFDPTDFDLVATNVALQHVH